MGEWSRYVLVEERGGEAVSGSCVQALFPDSASEGFLFSTPSPGGVDRACNDAGPGREHRKSKENLSFFYIFSLEASKTNGCSTF